MKCVPYKTAGYLKTRKDVAAYLNTALEDGNPAVLRQALRNVAQTKGGMGALAKTAGVSRESLYRTLSARGNPKVDTLIALLRAMNLKLAVTLRKAA